MQTEERGDAVGAGTGLDEAPDTDLIEVEDNLQDDIADAYDELALAAKPEEAKEPESKSKKPTSVDEDIQAAVDELSGKAKAEEAPKTAAKVEAKPNAAEVELKAPARFTAEEKEVFNKLPVELKKTAKKAFDDMQADYTKTKQFLHDGIRQLDEEKAQYADLTKTMNRYLVKWGSNGITPEQAITTLASVQDELTNPDKEVRKAAYARLLVSSALDPEDFADILGGHVQQPVKQQEIAARPALTPEEIRRQSYIDSLIERDQQSRQQAEAQEVQKVVAEIEQVREAKTADGRYVYPKLHDPAFVEQAKPLVLAIMRTTGDSWGEAFKKAYSTLVPDSQVGQTRLPSGNNRSNATIVRNSPTVRSNGQPTNFPEWSKDDGMSLEDDIMASLELLKRGGAGNY